MFIRLVLISSICIGFFSGTFSDSTYADILPWGASTLSDPSIVVDGGNADIIETSRGFGMKILWALKIVVSGFALVYLVLVGVYMIIFSENEERVKTQRRQITYALVGFLFLNMPWVVYKIFFGDTFDRPTPKDAIGGNTPNILFWNPDYLTGASGVVPMLTSFFEVFIFGVAIVTFTWGLFRLIMSGGDEEKQKMAKDRIIYGTLGLIFLWFVKFWGAMIGKWDFSWEFATVGNKFLGIALYFAGPIAIFFLVMWGYYYITSAGDEERIKKGKTILINTFIASIILIAAYSFFSDIISFRL